MLELDFLLLFSSVIDQLIEHFKGCPLCCLNCFRWLLLGGNGDVARLLDCWGVFYIYIFFYFGLLELMHRWWALDLSVSEGIQISRGCRREWFDRNKCERQLRDKTNGLGERLPKALEMWYLEYRGHSILSRNIRTRKILLLYLCWTTVIFFNIHYFLLCIFTF